MVADIVATRRSHPRFRGVTPFEGGMERERTTAICAPAGTPVYNFIPFCSEAALKYKFWSDLGHFGTFLDFTGERDAV